MTSNECIQWFLQQAQRAHTDRDVGTCTDSIQKQSLKFELPECNLPSFLRSTTMGKRAQEPKVFGFFLVASLVVNQLEALTPDGVALLEFKHGLNTTDGVDLLLQTWNASDASPCQWEGIQCTSTGFVDSISLKDLKGGVISPSLGRLEFLRTLDLESGLLQGGIPPELANCSRLETLNLMDNLLSGPIPAELGSLPVFASLLLSRNMLVGEIPTALAAPSNLSIFNVSANNLTGRVPLALYKNVNLRLLNVGENNLTGNITTDLEELSKLPNIMRIQMDDNNFTGTIPASLGNCSSLQHLDLGTNNLVGAIPSTLGNCAKLQTLILDTNPRLTGTIPPELGKLQKLSTIVITGTELHGDIPESLGNCSSLRYLVLSMNNLTGPVPKTLGQCSALEFINFANNNLSGDIPPELGNLTNLRVLQLGSNRFAGEWTVDFSRMTSPTLILSIYNNFFHNTSAFFASIATNPNFTIVDVCKNNLHGALPATYDVRLLSKLQVLMLGYNKIQGSIPPWLWNLSKIQILDVSNNNLSGEVASETFPSMQGFISRNVSKVPHNCHDLVNYYTQDFGFHLKNRNQAVTMSYLSYLTYLDISTNNLSGSIPATIGELSNLFYFNLTKNRFSGTIPPALGRISPLQSLDMSSNLLTGAIPSEFTSLSMLAIFRVSNNSLSGKIPQSTQLQSLGNDSFLPANENLCGLPLPRSCAVDANGAAPASGVPLQPSGDVVEAYFSIPGFAVGFGVGFVSVAVAMHFMYVASDSKKVAPASGFFLSPT